MAKPSHSLQQTSDLRKFISTIICWILLTCIHLPVLAEESAISGGSSVLIFTTTPSRLEEPVEDASGSVSVITAPEIEVQNPTTVPQVLRDLPGVRLQESGTMGNLLLFHFGVRNPPRPWCSWRVFA